MRYLYSFLIYLATPVIFLRLLWKSRRAPDYRRRWLERLGFCPHHLEKCIWIHAVSVGETIAAIPLIKALKATYPTLPLLVTNMTPTGAARVKAAFGDTVLQAYIPYDYPDAVKRFLKTIHPVVAIIMETELWPNLFAECKKQHIPLVITNARLSEKSAQGYQKVGSLTQNMLQSLSALASQGFADAERFIQLGAPKEKVVVTGNLKFDLELPADLLDKSNILRNQLGQQRLIWVAASTHPTEEEMMLAAHKKIQEKFPDALLILVPRHPDRFDAIAELIKQKDFSLQRRSQVSATTGASSPEVYLGDTMGELLMMYAVSDVAVVAGSFVNVGGHNMLEAAALAKPIMTGPQLFNFAEISEKLVSAKGMIVVNTPDELANQLILLFENAAFRERIGRNALQVMEENRGALKKQLDVIKSVMH